MRLVSIRAAVAVVSLACAGPVVAQDYPSIWTGFYAGAHGGYGEAFDEPGGFDVGGGLLGMHAGYNYQSGNLVFGVEGDYTGSWMEDTQVAGGLAVTLDVDYLASIRARLGYAAGNALLYGTIGYAWAEAGTLVNGLVNVSRSTDFDGLVLGGGVEYKFAQNWSARVEGLNYWLEPDANVDDLDVGVIRAGVTWHFN